MAENGLSNSLLIAVVTTILTTGATYLVNTNQFEKNRELILEQIDKNQEGWMKQNKITVGQDKQKHRAELFCSLIELNTKIDGLRSNYCYNEYLLLFNRARAKAFNNSPEVVNYYNNYLNNYRKIENDSMQEYKNDKAKFKSLLEDVQQEYSDKDIPAISENVRKVSQEVDSFYPQIESEILIDNYVKRIKAGVNENTANCQMEEEFYAQCNTDYKLPETFNSLKDSLVMVR